MHREEHDDQGTPILRQLARPKMHQVEDWGIVVLVPVYLFRLRSRRRGHWLFCRRRRHWDLHGFARGVLGFVGYGYDIIMVIALFIVGMTIII